MTVIETTVTHVDRGRAHLAQTVLDAVEEIAPVLRAEAAQSEQNRTLTPHAVEALSCAGLFRIACPTEVGGFDLNLRDRLDVIEAVARVNSTAGWIAMIQSSSAALVHAGASEEARHELFGGDFPLIAATAAPSGAAVEVDGGYRLSGRWSFASGIRHCEWVMAVAFIQTGEGDPRATVGIGGFIIPTRDVEVLDNWNTAGLRGTGSCDYAADNVFVPTARSIPAGRVAEITAAVPAVLEHLAFALGAAQGALDEINEQARAKVRLGANRPVAATATFQLDLGRASLDLEAARALARSATELLDELRADGLALGRYDLGRYRAIAAAATTTAVDVARVAYTYGGASAVRDDNRLQQVLRDLLVGAQHILVAPDALRSYGQLLLGQEPDDLLSSLGAQ